jgi:tRNA pseudouridine55 synthase
MEGVVNILKPPGMTSSDVVSEARKIFNEKRAGHTGTLDPGAAGVLPICIGRATRLFDYIIGGKKEYIGEISFGRKTDTQDSYGKVTAEGSSSVSEEQLIETVGNFMGMFRQKVPMYSAVKYKGKKLYELARKNINVEDRFREIDIHEITVLGRTDENRYLLKVSCSKGTYIRTLMEDIGNGLGVCSHLSFLLRTETGQFSIADSYTVNELRALKENGTLEKAVIPMDQAISCLTAVRLGSFADIKQKKLLFNGAKIELPELYGAGGQNASVRVYDERFMGIGVIKDGFLRMALMLGEYIND